MRKNKIGKRLLAILLLLICVLAIQKEAEAAKLNRKSAVLLKGKTVTLQLKGTKKKAVWKTSRKSVVRFVAKRNTSVKMKAYKVGSTTVSARVGKKTYKCKVQVVDPKLKITKVVLNVGDDKRLAVTGGRGKIKWSSSNSGIAAVNVSGMVTARKAGSAKIYAKQNGKKLTCMVTVQKSRTKPDRKPEKDNESTEDGKKLVEKKIWVVTQEAWIEYVPVYKNERTLYICRNCGFLDKETGLPVQIPNLSMLDFYIPVAGFETFEEFQEHLDESDSFFGKDSAECGYYRRVTSNHPVYGTHIECSCGARFRINSQGETEYNGEEEFKEHLANNSILFSNVIDKSCNNYTVHTYKDFSHMNIIEHPEEGYWKTEYVYE